MAVARELRPRVVVAQGSARLASAGRASCGCGALEKAPNLLLQKLPAESFTFETKLDWSSLPQDSRAGIAVMGKSHAALVAQRDEQGERLALLVDNQPVATLASPPRM